jgi:hypothetical protein
MSRPRKTQKSLPKYVRLHHGAYWFRPPNGKPVRLAEKGDESGMFRLYAEHVKPTLAGTGKTLGDHFDRYVREVLPLKAPRTQLDYLRHIGLLRDAFGHMHPDELLPKHVGQYLDVKKGLIQRNRDIAVLSSVYKKLVGKWFVADRNPCTKVERNPSKPRDRYITDEEFATVKAAMPPRHRVAMDLALLTGQRQGDLLKLKWEDVSEEGVYVQQEAPDRPQPAAQGRPGAGAEAPACRATGVRPAPAGGRPVQRRGLPCGVAADHPPARAGGQG